MGNRISSRVPNTNFFIFGSGHQNAAVRLPRQTLKDFLFVIQSFKSTWMKRIRLNTEFMVKLGKGKQSYSWALVACECPTRSWHFLMKWKVKNRRRDGTRRFLFDADGHELADTRASSKSLTIHILECSTVWSFFFANRNGKWHQLSNKELTQNFITMESWDPVANKPSSKGEKSKSVTKSEWAWRSG